MLRIMFAFAGLVVSSHAALVPFQSYVGKYGLSSDGFGSTGNNGVLTLNAPLGSTVKAAYLYGAYWASDPNISATLNGTAVAFGAAVPNPSVASGYIGSRRADVTSIVAPVINGGAGGAYNFNISEVGANYDGSALVLIYENPALAESSIGLLDGFSAVGGDSTSINFAQPLDPTAAGFFAEMRLGISFSCCNQQSTVAVNGTIITNTSGNFDDGLQQANGSLITMGGDDDPFSAFLPAYANDKERYDLAPYITVGDTSIAVRTNNPSSDDNIFLAAFWIRGRAGFDEPPPPPDGDVPEPSTFVLMGAGLVAVGYARRRRLS